MSVKLDPRDGVTWRYQKMVRGERISGTPTAEGLANTKIAALHAESQHVARVLNPALAIAYAAKHEPPKPSGGRFATIREFAVRFLAEYAPEGSHSSRQSRTSIVNGAIVPFLGHVRLDEIDQSHVNAWIATMKGQAANTINNKLVGLSTLLEYAFESRALAAIPSLKLRVSKKAGAKAATEVRAIKRAEVARLLHAVRGDARYAVVILLATDAGLRIGEIRALQWTDIKDRMITIRRAVDASNVLGLTKNAHEREIGPITDALADALAALPRRGIWLITPLPRKLGAPLGMLAYKGMSTRIKKAYREAKIEIDDSIAPFHSLRHTYGTELHALGVEIKTIMKLMGHVDITTTQRYITTTGEQMRAAMRRLNDG